jgi:hypothetical protein
VLAQKHLVLELLDREITAALKHPHSEQRVGAVVLVQ